MAAIATRAGAEAIVIRATPMRLNSAALGMPSRPVILTGAPTAFTNAVKYVYAARPNLLSFFRLPSCRIGIIV